MIHYDEHANIIQIIDQNGNAYVKNEYHEKGRVIGQYYLNDTKSTITYDEEQWFTYNDQGFMVEEKEKIKTGVYRKIVYERDTYGRIITEMDSEQGSTSFVYEENGEHLFTEPVIQTDAFDQQTLYTYDTMRRRTSIQTAYGTVEFRYNEKNALMYIRDGNVNETRRFYDKMGNLTEVLSPNQGTNGRAYTYEYDFFDKLICGTDPLGHHWQQERNLEGSVTKEVSQKGAKTVCRYDCLNQKFMKVSRSIKIQRK